jgi:Ca2+-binding RTX toxin-like protein
MAIFTGTNAGEVYDAPDGEVNLISGMGGNDSLTGGFLPDQIDGGAGDDTLIGLQGSDYITGGSGNDLILAGSDDDTVLAGLGADTIDAGRGDDLIDLAGRTSDVRTVIAGYGDDEVLAGKGADAINGGAGQDLVSYAGSGGAVVVDLAHKTASGGDAAGDVLRQIEDLIGSRFNDALTGNGLANVLDGGIGNDLLDGKAGVDLMAGGAGADTLRGGQGEDELDGGSGIDTAEYVGGAETMTIDLTLGAGYGGEAEGDSLSGIENVVVTPGPGFSILIGDSAANYLFGGDVRGLGGADRLWGSMMTGGLGADVFVATYLDGVGAESLIMDFQDGVDRIDLPIGWDFDDVQHSGAVDLDNDTQHDDLLLYFVFGGSSIGLIDRDWEIMDASDFI